jgi:mannose-6-phosphate isomerase-like protein (cupin superfamily)
MGSPDLSLPSLDFVAFARDGFLAPVPLFTSGQCQFICRHLQYGDVPEPLGWNKGRFATDRVMYDLAVRPTLLALLRPLFGESIVLWGTSVLVRGPGDVHPWHTDIESSAPEHRFISVWIGVQNTTRASSLKLISQSHRFGKTFQELAAEKGFRRGEASDDTVLAWARERDRRAALVQPEMKDGEAIVLDGRLWHGSDHTGASQRIALLFQYTAAGTPVLMPDLTQLEWPFRNKSEPVPVTLVSGSGDLGSNCVVAPPEVGENKLLVEVHPMKLPLPEDRVARWRPHHLFRGVTPNTQLMGAHVSVLSPGHSPHPPHAHREEEILIVLDGEAELVISEGPDDVNPRVEQLHEGSFVFYPAYQHHTIRNSTNKPITYLMFKWHGTPAEIEQPLGTTILNSETMPPPALVPFSATKLLDGPTAYLSKLHSHLTVLQPGAGYAAHADDHDVAIVILSGRVETMDRTVERHGVIFYSAAEMHDMKNIGETPARYLVFEFHAAGLSKEGASAPIPQVQAAPLAPNRSLMKELLASFWRRIPRREV